MCNFNAINSQPGLQFLTTNDDWIKSTIPINSERFALSSVNFWD